MGKLRESYLQLFLFIYLFVDLRVGCLSLCVSLAPFWKPFLIWTWRKTGDIYLFKWKPFCVRVLQVIGRAWGMWIPDCSLLLADLPPPPTTTSTSNGSFFFSKMLRNHDQKQIEGEIQTVFNLPLRDLAISPTLTDWLEWTTALTWTEMLITANLGSQSTL